jgi:copper chaperone CopZ
MTTALLVALAGGAVLCPVCVPHAATASAAVTTRSLVPPDTATARLHVSGMTCGSCPVTARLVLRRVPGVYSATVILGDSLAVVRYDPRKVTPARIAGELTRLTGFGARMLSTAARSAPRERAGGL